jgi:hypothetical protein
MKCKQIKNSNYFLYSQVLNVDGVQPFKPLGVGRPWNKLLD